MRRFATAILSAVVACTAGCSSIVAYDTKEISELMYEHASRAKIESVVGPPLSEQVFRKPYPATRVSDHATGLAASRATYEYRGRADDLDQFQGHGMVVGLTFGLAEPVVLPDAIKLSKRLENSVHHYEVWYDEAGRCIAYEAVHDFGGAR